MIFILRNYFHYQIFGANYVFGIIMLLKFYELWKNSERCFNIKFFKLLVLEVRFCAGRPHLNSTVWHIIWGIVPDNLEWLNKYTEFWLLQEMYILTDSSGKKSKTQEGNRNMNLQITPGVLWNRCESPDKCRPLKHKSLYKPEKVRGRRWTEEKVLPWCLL